MADIVPTSFKTDISGNINLGTDTLGLMLLTSAATPLASWAKRSDVTNEVAAGGGYSAGGMTVPGQSWTTSGTQGKFTHTAATWAASTITARYGVYYKKRGGLASADELIYILDFGADKSSSAGNFTITPVAGGLFTVG